MKDILAEILAHKRTEIEEQKKAIDLEQLRALVHTTIQEEASNSAPTRRSMKQALAASGSGIIAEFKRRSPSKGWIKEEAQAHLIPPAYEAAGAAALSILTDEKFFGGSLRDIRTVRPLVGLPILRKDFIIDEYQLLQARIVGADAVLLIAACISCDQCHRLTQIAHSLGLEVLLEIHSEHEIDYIDQQIDMVGVNNRNLGSFVTDVNNSFGIAKSLKQRIEATSATDVAELPLLVSESGISQPETIGRLRTAGFSGFLIGEAFMQAPHPGSALKEFIQSI